MNFFQCQNKLLFSKKDNVPANLDEEGQKAFVPYMTNRWLSFYDKNIAVFTNNTLNKFINIFIDDKDEQFKLYYFLIPTLKFKRITYAKKKKKESKEEDELKMLARNMMVSERELQQYVDYGLGSNK